MAGIPSGAGGLLEIGAPADGLVVGSPAWWAWLAQDDVRSFAFRSPEGNYTARKERRSRGGAYWVAYRMAAGRLHKAYLGKTDELTSARLAEAAATLAALVDAPAPSGSAAQARGTSEGLLTLATKLFAPRPRRDLVTRPRLLERLDAGLDGTRCTLLAAPPGAGKTTLVAEWLSGLDRPVAWLALDERAYGEAAAAARVAGLVHWTLVGTINQVSVQRIQGARRRALAPGQAALGVGRGAHRSGGSGHGCAVRPSTMASVTGTRRSRL